MCAFSRLPLTEPSVLLFASNEENLEIAEKTIKPPAAAIKQCSGVQLLGRMIFSVAQTWQSLASQWDLCFADHVVPGWRLVGTLFLF